MIKLLNVNLKLKIKLLNVLNFLNDEANAVYNIRERAKVDNILTITFCIIEQKQLTIYQKYKKLKRY